MLTTNNMTGYAPATVCAVYARLSENPRQAETRYSTLAWLARNQDKELAGKPVNFLINKGLVRRVSGRLEITAAGWKTLVAAEAAFYLATHS
jgi:hypothetical protein